MLKETERLWWVLARHILILRAIVDVRTLISAAVGQRVELQSDMFGFFRGVTDISAHINIRSQNKKRPQLAFKLTTTENIKELLSSLMNTCSALQTAALTVWRALVMTINIVGGGRILPPFNVWNVERSALNTVIVAPHRSHYTITWTNPLLWLNTPPPMSAPTRFHTSQGSADHVEPQLALLLPTDPQRPGKWHFRSCAERRPVLGGLLRLSGR